MFAGLLIFLLLAAGVAGVTGFGAPCFQLEGISEICLGSAEMLAAKVIMVAALAGAAAIAIKRPGRR